MRLFSGSTLNLRKCNGNNFDILLLHGPTTRRYFRGDKNENVEARYSSSSQFMTRQSEKRRLFHSTFSRLRTTMGCLCENAHSPRGSWAAQKAGKTERRDRAWKKSPESPEKRLFTSFWARGEFYGKMEASTSNKLRPLS